MECNPLVTPSGTCFRCGTKPGKKREAQIIKNHKKRRKKPQKGNETVKIRDVPETETTQVLFLSLYIIIDRLRNLVAPLR